VQARKEERPFHVDNPHSHNEAQTPNFLYFLTFILFRFSSAFKCASFNEEDAMPISVNYEVFDQKLKIFHGILFERAVLNKANAP